jgi:hypothetical protein
MWRYQTGRYQNTTLNIKCGIYSTHTFTKIIFQKMQYLSHSKQPTSISKPSRSILWAECGIYLILKHMVYIVTTVLENIELEIYKDVCTITFSPLLTSWQLLILSRNYRAHKKCPTDLLGHLKPVQYYPSAKWTVGLNLCVHCMRATFPVHLLVLQFIIVACSCIIGLWDRTVQFVPVPSPTRHTAVSQLDPIDNKADQGYSTFCSRTPHVVSLLKVVSV